MRTADLLEGAHCLPTCRLLHRADKSRSCHRTKRGRLPVLAQCPEGAVRCCLDMVNRRLRHVSLIWPGHLSRDFDAAEGPEENANLSPGRVFSGLVAESLANE